MRPNKAYHAFGVMGAFRSDKNTYGDAACSLCRRPQGSYNLPFPNNPNFQVGWYEVGYFVGTTFPLNNYVYDWGTNGPIQCCSPLGRSFGASLSISDLTRDILVSSIAFQAHGMVSFSASLLLTLPDGMSLQQRPIILDTTPRCATAVRRWFRSSGIVWLAEEAQGRKSKC
jgi:hypothetical protein